MLFVDLPPGVTLLRGVARDAQVLDAVESIAAVAPFRTMVTPRGPMSVRMTNCGDFGWVSDERGYRYDANDPVSGARWPTMPPLLRTLASDWAARAGFEDFTPNACLVNQYLPGTQMGLHQDKDENDVSQPIVSVSLGIPATFVIGGTTRDAPKQDVLLEHGDVVVFGGPARRMYHGIKRLAAGTHPLVGARRINLTFRYVNN